MATWTARAAVSSGAVAVRARRRSFIVAGPRGLRAGARELLDQLALALGQPLRQLGVDLRVEVAAGRRAEARHALAAEPEDPAVLGAGRDRQRERPPVRRGHARLATEEQRLERRADLRVQVVAAALEARIGRDRDDEIDVAGRTAALAGTALAGDPDARAGPHARRDLDLEAAGLAVRALDLELSVVPR